MYVYVCVCVDLTVYARCTHPRTHRWQRANIISICSRRGAQVDIVILVRPMCVRIGPHWLPLRAMARDGAGFARERHNMYKL